MGRPQTIFVTDADVLKRITNAYTTAGRELAAAMAQVLDEFASSSGSDRHFYWQEYSDLLRFHYHPIAEYGIEYNVNALADRELTASERVRWCESVRRLIAAGKVEKCGRNIKPTGVTLEPAPTQQSRKPANPKPASTTPEGANDA